MQLDGKGAVLRGTREGTRKWHAQENKVSPAHVMGHGGRPGDGRPKGPSFLE